MNYFGKLFFLPKLEFPCMSLGRTFTIWSSLHRRDERVQRMGQGWWMVPHWNIDEFGKWLTTNPTPNASTLHECWLFGNTIHKIYLENVQRRFQKQMLWMGQLFWQVSNFPGAKIGCKNILSLRCAEHMKTLSKFSGAAQTWHIWKKSKERKTFYPTPDFCHSQSGAVKGNRRTPSRFQSLSWYL